MKKENKKKVVTLSAMAALLAVVLGMGGKTYAKYFSSNNVPAETATVAKWGVVVNVQGDLFGSDYTGGAIVNGDGAGVNAESPVVAPGTKGSVTVDVTGTPEVSSKITFDVKDGIKAVGIYASASATQADYEPIVWEIKKDSSVVADIDTLAEVVSYLESQTKEYAPNEDLKAKYEISWSWKFYEDDATDKLDTELTDKTNSSKTYVTSFDFGLTVKVEQTNK